MGHTVHNFSKVLRFGWKYMRPYWTRLVLGILFGIFCGLTAAGFIWATRTLAERLENPEVVAAERAEEHAKEKREKHKSQILKLPQSWQPQAERLKQSSDKFLDEWLPRAGRKMQTRHLIGVILFLPLLAFIRGATDYISNYCMSWVSERVVNDLRCDVLSKITTLSLDYFNRASTGDLMTRINADTVNFHRALRQGCSDFIKEIFTMIGVLGTLVLLDPALTLFVMIFVPVVLIPLFVLGKKARKASRETRKANVGQNSMLIEALVGIRVVKAFHLENLQIKRFREFSKKLVHHGMKGAQAKEMVNPLIEVIGALGVGILVAYLFWTKQSLEDLVSIITGLLLFFVPIKKMASVHILFEQASAGVERLLELLHEKPTVVEPAKPKKFNGFAKEIRFDNVTFGYGAKTVLNRVHLRVPRGFKLGVAGESGSGKTTLVNLLYRFYDVTSGTVTLDGADVRELSFEDLRRQMALVSQDVFVFRTTVAENIAAGKLGATREDIEAAARAANAHDFIMQLPNGYDTLIGERGMTISGGQRQRLAIARAFVRNAPILVLDEATASLDSQSEAEVQAAIDRLEQNRTVICVAHRLSTLAKMDHIIVLSNGNVVEQGTFTELIRMKGIFAGMAAKQGIFAA
jgi:ABC-type multidrug transport system fused ATPase/permease subunit